MLLLKNGLKYLCYSPRGDMLERIQCTSETVSIISIIQQPMNTTAQSNLNCNSLLTFNQFPHRNCTKFSLINPISSLSKIICLPSSVSTGCWDRILRRTGFFHTPSLVISTNIWRLLFPNSSKASCESYNMKNKSLEIFAKHFNVILLKYNKILGQII